MKGKWTSTCSHLSATASFRFPLGGCSEEVGLWKLIFLRLNIRHCNLRWSCVSFLIPHSGIPTTVWERSADNPYSLGHASHHFLWIKAKDLVNEACSSGRCVGFQCGRVQIAPLPLAGFVVGGVESPPWSSITYSCEVIWNVSFIELRMWNQVSYDPRSYERNLCNCLHSNLDFTGIVTSRYRCGALINWAMQPLTLGVGHFKLPRAPPPCSTSVQEKHTGDVNDIFVQITLHFSLAFWFVSGKGKIVTKKWIFDSFAKSKRLSTRQ